MSTRIKQVAESYIGQTEVTGNAGFTNKSFEAAMKAVGWQPSQSWCAFFTELVWKEAIPDKKDVLNKLFSGSATATYANFTASGKFKNSSKPQIGALAVWRYGTGWQGHIGIVTDVVDSTTFLCVEGNTNDLGGREGYIVAKRKRKVGEPVKAKGLNLIGFILPE